MSFISVIYPVWGMSPNSVDWKPKNKKFWFLHQQTILTFSTVKQLSFPRMFSLNSVTTRMHSSRMRTGRLLTVFRSLLFRGGCLVRGVPAWSQGGCLVWGVSGLGDSCLVPGGSGSGGVWSWGGVSGPWGCLVRGGVWSWGRGVWSRGLSGLVRHSPAVNRMNDRQV